MLGTEGAEIDKRDIENGGTDILTMLGTELAEINNRDIEKGRTDEVEKEEVSIKRIDTQEELKDMQRPSWADMGWILLNNFGFAYMVSKIYKVNSEILARYFALFIIGRMYFMVWLTDRRLGMPNQLIGGVWIIVGDGIALVSTLMLREAFPYDGSDSSRNSLLILAAIYISTGHDIVCVCIVFFFCGVMCYKYILYSVPISLEDKKDELELLFEFSLDIMRGIIRFTQLDSRVARLSKQVFKIIVELENKLEVLNRRIGYSEEDLKRSPSFVENVWISLNTSTFLFMVSKIYKINSGIIACCLMLFIIGRMHFMLWVTKRRLGMPNQLIGRVWIIVGNGIALVSALILRKAFPYDGSDISRNSLLILVNLTFHLYSWLKILRGAVDMTLGDLLLKMTVEAAIYISTGHDIVCICIALFFSGVMCYKYISYSVPISNEDKKDDLELLFEFSLEIMCRIIWSIIRTFVSLSRILPGAQMSPSSPNQSTQLDSRVAESSNQVSTMLGKEAAEIKKREIENEGN